MTTPSTSEMYFGAVLPDGRLGLGAQIYPEPETYADWQARGEPVADRPYDVRAISVSISERPTDDPEDSLRTSIEEHVGRTGLSILVR